eukprot:366064-Chlamydomonas_euryale.AAC.9
MLVLVVLLLSLLVLVLVVLLVVVVVLLLPGSAAHAVHRRGDNGDSPARRQQGVAPRCGQRRVGRWHGRLTRPCWWRGWLRGGDVALLKNLPQRSAHADERPRARPGPVRSPGAWRFRIVAVVYDTFVRVQHARSRSEQGERGRDVRSVDVAVTSHVSVWPGVAY